MAPKKLQNCALVDHFAIVVQVLLGAIACSTLIYKRHRERPQRPLLIWFYDVSKQVLGAGIVHGLNILFSYIAGSHNTEDTNPCIWYFLNIFVDCTIGVFILFVILKIVHRLLTIYGVEGINSGDYGQPPQYIFWVKQTMAFIFCLILMKIVVITLFRLCPFLFDIAEWILGWTLYDVKLQVVFVMLIFPLIMNIIQFWLVDQVIKKKFEIDGVGIRLGRGGTRRRRRRRHNHFVVGDDDEDDGYGGGGGDDDDDDDDDDSIRNENEVFLNVDSTDDDEDDVIINDGKEMNYNENLPFHLKRINSGEDKIDNNIDDDNNDMASESFSMNDINNNNRDNIIIDNNSTDTDEIYTHLRKNPSSSLSPRKKL